MLGCCCFIFRLKNVATCSAAVNSGTERGGGGVDRPGPSSISKGLRGRRHGAEPSGSVRRGVLGFKNIDCSLGPSTALFLDSTWGPGRGRLDQEEVRRGWTTGSCTWHLEGESPSQGPSLLFSASGARWQHRNLPSLPGEERAESQSLCSQWQRAMPGRVVQSLVPVLQDAVAP